MLGLQLAVNQSDLSNVLLLFTYRGLPDGQSAVGDCRKETTIARDTQANQGGGIVVVNILLVLISTVTTIIFVCI